MEVYGGLLLEQGSGALLGTAGAEPKKAQLRSQGLGGVSTQGSWRGVGSSSIAILVSASLSLRPASTQRPPGEAITALEWTWRPWQPQAGCSPEGLAGQERPPQEPHGSVSGSPPTGATPLAGIRGQQCGPGHHPDQGQAQEKETLGGLGSIFPW